MFVLEVVIHGIIYDKTVFKFDNIKFDNIFGECEFSLASVNWMSLATLGEC